MHKKILFVIGVSIFATQVEAAAAVARAQAAARAKAEAARKAAEEATAAAGGAGSTREATAALAAAEAAYATAAATKLSGTGVDAAKEESRKAMETARAAYAVRERTTTRIQAIVRGHRVRAAAAAERARTAAETERARAETEARAEEFHREYFVSVTREDAYGAIGPSFYRYLMDTEEELKTTKKVDLELAVDEIRENLVTRGFASDAITDYEVQQLRRQLLNSDGKPVSVPKMYTRELILRS